MNSAPYGWQCRPAGSLPLDGEPAAPTPNRAVPAMRAAHIDAFAGTSGDMLLGALIDAGVTMGDLETVLRGLPLDGWSLAAEQVVRAGIGATAVQVESTEAGV